MAVASRKKNGIIPRKEAARLLAAAEKFMAETGKVLARCSNQIPHAEWEAMGKCLADLWCVVGDDIIYPVGDSHPDLIEHLRLPKGRRKSRRWGPLRQKGPEVGG